MSIINDLRKTKARAIEKLGTEEAINNSQLYDALKAEISEIDAKLERAEDASRRAADLARPAAEHVEGESQTQLSETVNPDVERRAYDHAGLRGADLGTAYSSRALTANERFERALATVRSGPNGIRVPKDKAFRGLGEQLQAIYNAAMSRGSNVDARLVRAPTGAGEVDPTAGGFLVQTDFAAAIFMLAHQMGDVLGQVNKIPIGEKFNGIKIPGVDETSRATGSRWGGVQSYYADEGTTATNTKPKFRMIEFTLHKLISIMYTSDELLQDQAALSNIASQAFSEEIQFMTEDGIFEGTGAGQPLGIIPGANGATAPVGAALSGLSTYQSTFNDPAYYYGPTLILPAVKGQSSGTIIKANIDQLWTRMWVRSRPRAVWLANQDVEPQLFALNAPVGTGGIPVYIPPNGLSGEPFARLYGRPVIFTEYNPGVGRPGDIVFADLSQYTFVDKGGVQAATSMHVAFLTDQMVFRITYRFDGKPMWTVPLAPFAAAGLYHSPFVALASR
jgi:HK97 family phage major capsid protein